MIRRRRKIGLSLLVAGTGLSMAIGCNPDSEANNTPEDKPEIKDVPTGNLMPPPTIKFCVEAEPKKAEVKVDQQPLIENCTYLYPGSKVTIEAEAKGFKNYKEEVEVTEDMTHKIELSVDRSSGNTLRPPVKPKPEPKEE